MQKAAGSVDIIVRIKPYNPNRNRTRKRFHTFFGFNFSEEKGWCKVPSKIIHGGKTFDVAEYLRNARNVEDDPESECVFDVCTLKEAQDIDAKERAEKERRLTADEADRLGGVNHPVELGTGPTAEPTASEDRKPKTARGRHAARP